MDCWGANPAYYLPQNSSIILCQCEAGLHLASRCRVHEVKTTMSPTGQNGEDLEVPVTTSVNQCSNNLHSTHIIFTHTHCYIQTCAFCYQWTIISNYHICVVFLSYTKLLLVQKSLNFPCLHYNLQYVIIHPVMYLITYMGLSKILQCFQETKHNYNSM